MRYIAGSDGSALGGDLPPSLDEVVRSPRAAAKMAQHNYPKVLWTGVMYAVAEHVGDRWLLGDPVHSYPQDARDSMGYHFRVFALRRSTPAAAREEYWEASALLERERINELTVAGRRFRAVRIDRFTRVGPPGPESPRATDPDDVPEPTAADLKDRFCHVPLPEAQTPGGSELLGERWEAVPVGNAAPVAVAGDARRALRTHPRVAVLAPRFIVLTGEDGHWSPCCADQISPRAARQSLARRLRDCAEEDASLSDEERAAIAGTIKTLGLAPVHEVVVHGTTRYRIVRVEQVVRVSDDGPEPPRPSDYDPDEPLTGETAELRTWELRDE